MSYEIIWEPKGAVKRFFGEVTNHDMLQSVIESEGDERFDSLRFVINDFLDCVKFSFDHSVVEDIAIMDRGASQTNPDILIAVVTTAEPVVSATFRYADTPILAYPIQIFSTMAAARTWLIQALDSRPQQPAHP